MIAVYPGSFDPVTNGHLDIIERSAKMFDELYVAVLKNSSKTPLFTLEERCGLIDRVTGHINNIEILSFDGLLVDFMKKINAKVIVKGLRAMSDFEYEFQMALANRRLDGDIETMFLVTSMQNQYVSSSFVKDVARYGASLNGFVPKEIENDIYEKLIK